MSFWQELKQRHVFRVGAIYLAVSWLIIQVVSAVAEPLNLPDWFDTVVILLLAGGFPVALLLAWALELTPDGIRREQGAAARRAPAVPVGRTIDFAIIGVLVIALALTLLNRTPPAPDNSIAVLLFTDQSDDVDQNYLSRSIPSEILNRLVTVEGLFIAGENSSFQFDVGTSDYQTIGAALNVAYVLEGNYLKVGERIRVRPQLVGTSDGVAVWSDIYNGEGADIFSILPDIAVAIADSLSVELGVREQEMRYFGTDSVVAYDHFLRGREAWATGNGDAAAEFAHATEIDQNYAEAWAWLSTAYGALQGNAESEEEYEALYALMKDAADRAVELDPELWVGHASLAWALLGESDWIGANESFQNATRLAQIAGARMGFREATFIEVFGHMEEGVRRLEAQLEVDPYNRETTTFLWTALQVMGRYDDVRGRIEGRGLDYQPSIWNFAWFMDRGEADRVQAAMAMAPEGSIENRLSDAIILREDTLALIRSWLDEPGFKSRNDFIYTSWWAGYYGDTDLAVELLRRAFLTYGWGGYFRMWHEVLSETRQTPEFKEFLIDLGFAELWRETGDGNDYCQPLPGGDDFECVR
jgi:TolB-like protein/tetratricopeptide (TPR) repeat protein